MKKIGLIGGMSWESTVTYYQLINEAVSKSLGGLHSAEIILYSVDFAVIEKCQADGDWQKSGEILTAAAQSLQKAGADYILICTNTMHKVVPQIQAAVSVPIVHIADATVEQLKKAGITKTALLGTKYTMEQDFYKERLISQGIEVLIPDKAGIETVNDVIYQELCRGIIRPESKQKFRQIVEQLVQQGAQGVILGCTEIGLLVHPQDVSIPVFDTTVIHAAKAAELAMGGSF